MTRLILLVLVGFVMTTPALRAETVSGTASYLERMAAPSGVRFVAVLEDVSRADAPAEVLGRVEIDDAGNPPYAFEIDYDPQTIEPSHTYLVRASLSSSDGTLLFASDTFAPVLTQGASNDVEIVMRRVEGGTEQSFAVLGAHGLHLPATFIGTLPCADCEGIEHHLDLWPDQSFHLRRVWLGREGENRMDEVGRWVADPARDAIVLLSGTGEPLRWKVSAPDSLRLLDTEGNPIASDLPYDLASDGTLRETDLAGMFLGGMMTYMADAAVFEECVTGWRYPMVQDGDYLELERAYLAGAVEPGAPLYVHVEGSLEMRPAMEGPDRRSLVVDRFIRTRPGVFCERQRLAASLTNTYWRIDSLRGRAVTGLLDRREPYLVFGADAAPRFSASVGCNQMVGGYEMEEARLVFGPAASTMMACPSPLDMLEQMLGGVLEDVRSLETSGASLALLNEAGEAIARLTAVHGP